MTHIGVRVYVLNLGPWPLNRQLDEQAGELLGQMMGDLGVEIMSRVTARRILGDNRVEAIQLSDDRILRSDLCLVAAGIRADAALAAGAGLAMYRGVVVNDRMMTSDPSIYAIGDVVNHRGRIYGLWPASMDQAQVAVTNILGGDARYKGTIPPTKLKVASIDLLSVGEISGRDGGQEIRLLDTSRRQYQKLVIRDGKVEGAILIGHKELADGVAAAVEVNLDVSDSLDALERGDWSCLTERELSVVAPT
jgi:NAD(P)H-nitrite reductase large subunit